MAAFFQKVALLLRAGGPAEPVDHLFCADDIAQLQRVAADPAGAPVDDPTWDALLLDAYFSRLTGKVSIFGQQQLYRQLRDGVDDAARDAQAERVRQLMREPALLEALRGACRPLRNAEADVAALLFAEGLPAIAKWGGYGWVLGAGLLVSVSAVVLSPAAWLGAGFFLYQLIAIQLRFHRRLLEWDASLNALQMMLRSASLLGALDHPSVAEFAREQGAGGRVNRSLTRSVLDFIPGVREYRDWFIAANVAHYFRSIGLVAQHRDFLRACYLRVAAFEADLALAQHLLQAGPTCWAERSDGAVVIEQAVHPLLERPAALSIALEEKGALVTGQNGVGKSTLLRTVGLNLLAARAFGFCYASRARVPMQPVYASMHSEDSMLGGTSLYIAELQRARELLAAAAQPRRAVFIIDEIFRGTNHHESVAAAAAVLDELAAKGMVIVSTHNLVLASLLEHRLAPLCVAAGADGALTVAPGVLAHTNGIALLARQGFGAAIETKAAKVFDWLGAFLTQPGGGRDVLRADAVTLRRA